MKESTWTSQLKICRNNVIQPKNVILLQLPTASTTQKYRLEDLPNSFLSSMALSQVGFIVKGYISLWCVIHPKPFILRCWKIFRVVPKACFFNLTAPSCTNSDYKLNIRSRLVEEGDLSTMGRREAFVEPWNSPKTPSSVFTVFSDAFCLVPLSDPPDSSAASLEETHFAVWPETFLFHHNKLMINSNFKASSKAQINIRVKNINLQRQHTKRFQVHKNKKSTYPFSSCTTELEG